MKNFFMALIVLLLTGCATTPAQTQVVSPTFEPTRTQTITPTPLPSATPTLTQAQIVITRLQTLGLSDFETREGQTFTAEGNPIRVDALDVITAPSDDGLTWWNTEIQEWVLVDPINPDTYPTIYFEHWNNLPTRTPVKLSDIPTEDIAFNDFQIETYRYYFPSIQSNLDQDPLWHSFFQDNGSDFSAMSAEQIHQASLLYGQTSKEIIMPIVLLEQQNQANPDSWKYTYETSTYDGIIFDQLDPTADKSEDLQHFFKENDNRWGFDQNYFGATIHIDNIPIREFRGVVQAQFRVPGVDPDVEVGLIVSFDNGKHLDFSVSFEDVAISTGDLIICYCVSAPKIIFSSPDDKIFPALDNQWDRSIKPQRLKEEIIGTWRNLFIDQYIGNRATGCGMDIFSKYSGLQLVGTIFTAYY